MRCIKKIILSLLVSLFFYSTAQNSIQYYFDKSEIFSDTKLNCSYPFSLNTEINEKKASYVFWQENDENSIYISLKQKYEDQEWILYEHIAGPFKYNENVPLIYSAAANKSGTTVLAASGDDGSLEIWSSKKDFSQAKKEVIKNTLPDYGSFLIPKVYVSASGGFYIFISAAKEDQFSIFYTTSKDGVKWSKPVLLPAEGDGFFNPIAPVLTATESGDTLVYQAQYTKDNLISFQLFAMETKNFGKNWSVPKIVTSEESVENGNKFYNYNNQAPFLLYSGGNIYLAWERSSFSSPGTTDIFTAKIKSDGTIVSVPEKINSETGRMSRPVLFESDNKIHALWFRAGSSEGGARMSVLQGLIWNEENILSTDEAILPCPVNDKKISFVWEHKTGKTGVIEILKQDTSSPSPSLSGLGFSDGEKSAKPDIELEILGTEDPSGIKGFSWSWSQDSSVNPEKTILVLKDRSKINVSADKDGTWYFKAAQTDYAGNWSKPAVFTYVYDTTPPEKVKLKKQIFDDLGFLESNTFEIAWDKNQNDDDVEGYTWSLELIDTLPGKLAHTERHPIKLSFEEAENSVSQFLEKNESVLDKKNPVLPARIISKNPVAKFSNARNGLYLFSVAAVDFCGNIGQSISAEILLNKYIPVTSITTADAKTDDFGDTKIEIIGNGFLYDGTVTSIILDRDGTEPFDRILKLSSKDYKINSDSRISGIKISGLETGSYRIGLVHSDRGLYFPARERFSVTETGTVKSKLSALPFTGWIFSGTNAKINFSITDAIILIFAALALTAAFAAVKGLTVALKDTRKSRNQTRSILKGDNMIFEKKNKKSGRKLMASSLKSKLVLHTSVLILSLDTLIFIAFGTYMNRTQERTLTKSLYDRVSVMLDSMCTGAKIYLPQTTSADNLSLTDIVSQSKALAECNFATITGYPEGNDSTSMDAVWATTSEEILLGSGQNLFIPGKTRISSEKISEVAAKCALLNEKAALSAEELSKAITEVTKEGLSLASKNDEASTAKRAELQTIRSKLISKLDLILEEIATEGSGTIPEFSTEKIDPSVHSYIFYRPIIYRQGSSSNYVHGIALMEIETDTLMQRLGDEKKLMLNTGIILMIVAVILSFITTSIIASLIVKPIKKLDSHVAMIRDEKDKEKLKGKEISIRTKDEIGRLGDTINEMTKNLAEAAAQTKNITFGKEVQAKFLPLQTDSAGNSLTTGRLETKGADFFSYYAGADALSGDYFDYKALDATHYAVIKCDVSGHGIPAALIMIEVATLFLNYFKNWSMSNPSQGTNLAPVVGQINDLLESRGFKGRFAAFTLCIIDVESGDCWFCNAGDNLVQIYDSALGKKKTITLQETPAAGMFSTDMINMKGGYKVTKLRLKKDDVLFLYTDGIEEAKRIFRDRSGKPVDSEESGEEMSDERISDIIEAVYKKKEYILHKAHPGNSAEDLKFDFRDCKGSAEDAVMALVSAEKMFRMYTTKEQNDSDIIHADKKIDAFLREHFVQYSELCSAVPEEDKNSAQTAYRGMREDPQYDDLTLVAIKKK